MKRKGLMRRVLASVLCASLVFQNVSVTAYATESNVEAVTEVSTEETSEEISDEAEASETAESSEQASDNVQTVEETKSEEASSSAENVEETSEAEVNVEEEAVEAVETVVEETVEAVETETATATETTTETETETTSTTEPASDVVKEEAFAEIVIDESALEYYAEDYCSFSYDRETKTVNAEYSINESNPFDGLLSIIKDKDNYYSYDIITVDVEDDITHTLKSNLTYKWQAKNAEGTYTDMAAGEVPVNVGEYKLVISLDQKFGKSEPEEINFEITKAVLTIDTSAFNVNQKSGVTVKEIKEDLTEALKLVDSDYNECAWDSYIKAFTITVRDTAGTEAYADDFILKKGSDYSIDVTAELADAFTAGYELEPVKVINLKINDLKKTKLTITTSVVENEKDITRVYDGNPVAEPYVTATEGTEAEIAVEVIVDGEIDEATGEDKVLEVAYDSLIHTWYDADGVELEAEPVDAGVYFFELKYTDSEGIYDESSAQVKVVVEPKTIVLKPATDVTEFFVGDTATDVTSNVVYTLANTDETEFKDWVAETFWGVSYNNPGKPQSYAPVFKLQMGQTPKAEEGKEAVTTWTDVTGEIVTPTGTDEKGTKTEYRVVFAGTKALYTNGVANDIVDIKATDVNSADKNHVVDTTAATIEKYAVAVTVNASAKATIDTTAMLIEGMAEKDVNGTKLYSKIYDGNQLYADRSEYKKAVVKDEAGAEIVSGTADELTYTWYEFDWIEETDENGNVVKKPGLSDLPEETYYDSMPSNAGLYALKVSYDDPEHKYKADSAYLYFEIEEQLIKLIPEGTPEVYEGAPISSFVNGDADDIAYKVYQIPGNDLTLTNDKLVEIPEWSSEAYWAAYYEDYLNRPYDEIDWFVMKGDNTNKDIAKYTRVYNESEGFVLAIPYKLGAEIDFRWYSDEINYADNYEVVVDEQPITEWTCDKPYINVKPKAENQLVIDFDASKLTKEMLEKVYDGKPIDISEAIANGFIIVTNSKTGEEIPLTGENALELSYRWQYEYYDEEDDDYYYRSTTNPVNVDEYTLVVSYAGDDTYQFASNEYSEKFVITPRELTITPAVSETIVAGWDMDNLEDRELVADNSKVTIEGYIAEDADAFAYTDSVYDVLAFDDIYINVIDENDNYNDGYLRTGKDYVAEYSVSLNEDVLWNEYANNYDVVVKSVKFQPNKRGNSTVNAVSVPANNYNSTRLDVLYSDLAVEVKPLEGIAYNYNTVTDWYDNELEPGNYFVISIKKPVEFYSENNYSVVNDAVYKNSIENAGGYILRQDNSYITVAFNAATPESGDNTRVFDIIWEQGYTETITVDLTNAELEDDLRTAVAPKSLKFNGVTPKMIVGENQQLDVKITKYLIDDVICLNYRVIAGEDVVSVTDTGYVTALKNGTATIEVYPVKYDSKGNEVELTLKKPVTTKITVSDVTAPKAGKPYAYDTHVEVTYTKPSDGYRREIYILEGKGLKVDAFEAKITEMNQGSFEGIKVGYVTEYNNGYYDDEDNYYWTSKYDSIKNQVTYKVKGLKPNTDYTVYVRNVSGIRTNAQDDFVVLSHAGSVKSFKTTKVQAYELDLYFDSTQPVVWNDLEDRREVELAKKKIKITTRGCFDYKPENDAADADDVVGYDLPLAKEKQNTYVNPKLSYYAVASTGFEDYKTGSYTVKIGDRYYAPSNIAKVDKKGNIKLNGAGWVYIIAYDSISKLQSEPYELYVSSPVTKITAKKITLKVGEPVYINNFLTFFNGKAKIKLDPGVTFITNAEFVSGDGVELLADEYGDYMINAVQSDKSAVVKVSLADNPEVFVNVNIKTKALTPVKKLKATNVMDDSARLTFTHSIDNDDDIIDSDFNYKIEIRDNRNALVRSELVNIDNLTEISANYAKRVFEYSYTVIDLVRKSDYKISVTPVYSTEYGTETAKAATVKVKTTEIPAWDGELLDEFGYGGMPIYYAPYDMSIDYGYFTSGKLYTFIADMNWPEDLRPTDTLTWKSSNSKIATIKANSDNMTATFNALAPGYTTIEVSSKLRKGVIARYDVYVKAVGAAGGTEFGDYEINDFDPYYTKSVEVLTESNPVRVNTDDYDYTWIKFEAPAYGKYAFRLTGDSYYSYYYDVQEARNKYIDWWYDYDDTYESDTITLNEGETIYLKALGSFTMTVDGEKYSKLTTTTSVNSSDSQYVIFTAPEDNCYIFEATKAGKSAYYTRKKSDGTTFSAPINFRNGKDVLNGELTLNKGDVVTFTLEDYDKSDSYDISVSKRDASAITATAADTGEIKAGEEKWFVFKADVAGTYEFKLTDATEGIKAQLYKQGLADISADEDFDLVIENTTPENDDEVAATEDKTNNYVCKVDLSKDDTVAVRVYADGEAAGTAKISVSSVIVDALTLGTPKEASIAKNGEAWLAFTVDETKAKYTFNVTGEAGKDYKVNAEYFRNSVTNKMYYLSTGAPYSDVEKGDVIYIKLTSTNTTDDTAKATVLVTKATSTEITLDAAKELTFENGKEYVYTFTAPSYGLYVFQSDVTVNAEGTGTHRLIADRYADVNSLYSYSWAGISDYSANDFYKEVKLAAGEKVVFAVKSNDTDIKDAEGNAASTKAKISVTKVTPEVLPAEITFAEDTYGDVKWYKFTATADDKYIIKIETKSGEEYVSGLNGLADVKRSATLQDSGYMSSVYYDGTDIGNMSAGDTLYFRVVSKNADKEKTANIKLTVTGTESLVKDIPTSAFEVANGESNTYKFTVTKAGRYKVNFKSNTEGVNPTVTYATSYNGYEYSVSNGDEMVCTTVGATYYFKVTNTDAEKKASVTLSVTEVTATDIKDETTSVTVKSNEAQWFAYTVPVAGRYSFTATTGENKDAYDGIDFFDKITNDETTFDFSEKWLKKSRVVYIRLNNSGAEDVSVKLTVKAIATEDITADTAKDISLKNGETKWYKFTADEATYYTFAQQLADGMYVNAYYYKNTGDSKYSINDTCIKLEKNDSLYIKVTRNDGSETESLVDKFTIKKETVLELKEGEDLKIELTSTGKQYVKFVPSRTAYYAFGVKEVPEGVDVYGIDDYEIESRNIANERIFCVRADFESENKDDKKSFKLYAEEIKPVALTADGADVKVAKYQRAWYTFEAPEDGMYNFTTDSTNEQIKYEIYDNKYYDELDDSGSMPLEEYAMSKGEKLTIAVYYNSNKADKSEEKVADSASFKLNVKAIEPKTMATDGATAELESDAYVWYSYTATKTGEYKFACENGSMDLYESMADWESVSNTLLMEAGDTVYVRLQNYSSEKQSVKVTVTCVEALTLAMDKATEVSFTAEEIEKGITYKWLAYTNAKTGYYKFSKEAVNGNVNVYYGEAEDDINDEYLIGTGKTVYIKVYANSEASAKISVAKGATEFECEVITLNQTKLAQVAENEAVYYEFTAPKAGRYKFYSANQSGDPYSDLYNSKLSWLGCFDDEYDENDNYISRNFSFTRNLDANETVYLKVYDCGYGSMTCDVHVTLVN